MKYVVYSDESCHLEYDKSPIMVLGAMYCDINKKEKIFREIRDIKKKYGLSPFFEIKWTKVSESKIEFYLELLDYFWNNDSLFYRGLVAKGKRNLDHLKYNSGNYDLWYYKMYFLMLDAIVYPENEYKILIDIKDTLGGKRVKKLHEVLCNNKYDFRQEVISQICQINSKESEILQLADLINGSLAFYNRGLYSSTESNNGKRTFVNTLRGKISLDVGTSREEKKFNLFIWSPRS